MQPAKAVALEENRRVTAPDEVRESPRGKTTLPQFDSKQEPGANHARPRSERPRQRSQGGQLRMEPFGAQRSQPVATGSKRDGAENGSLKQKPLPSVATSCMSRSMVRRGPAVRVRQRAL